MNGDNAVSLVQDAFTDFLLILVTG